MIAPVMDFPESIQVQIADAELEPVTIGMSGNEVFRFKRRSGHYSYLKVSPNRDDEDFYREFLRLQFLEDKLPVPVVQGYSMDDHHTYLILSEVPGRMSCEPEFGRDMKSLVRALAEGMRMIHEVSTADCPLDQTIDMQITRAIRRTEAGLVDASEFDARFKGKSAQEALFYLRTHRPDTEDLVFTHGDYCLPNVILDPTTYKVTGFVDLSRAGVADRYQDLALATRSLLYNFGPGYHEELWNAYGLDKVDHDKLSFYLALDEFFKSVASSQ